MELERLVCNSCGAPLEVPSSAKFVTCSHCSGVLQIRRTESAIYTELLADIAEKTEELSERIDDLATNSELNAIDNQWQIDRKHQKEWNQNWENASCFLHDPCFLRNYRDSKNGIATVYSIHIQDRLKSLIYLLARLFLSQMCHHQL